MAFLKITPDTKIYILGTATVNVGGPELLHQLCSMLNGFGKAAYMFYLRGSTTQKNKFAQRYNCKSIDIIDDSNKNVLIIPEIYADLSFIQNFKNIQKVLWWLGVHTIYYKIFVRSTISIPIRCLNYLYRNITGRPGIEWLVSEQFLKCIIRPKSIKNLVTNFNLHLAQSFYAYAHLSQMGFSNVAYLSDYIDDTFITTDCEIDNKENIVLYNGRRGYSFISKLISKSQNIQFIKVANMPRYEVINLFKKAKVYVDFGCVSGKDRMPREAAVLGCCVITSKRGAAGFYEDYPFPNDFKFYDIIDNIPKILSKITYCLIHYNEAVQKFEAYRNYIHCEKTKFKEDCIKIFGT